MHIVLPNSHWSNRGDEAAHRALWEELFKLYPGCHLTVLFKDRKAVKGVPEYAGLSYSSAQFKASLLELWVAVLTRGYLTFKPALKKAVATLKTADLIIYPPGGAVISDRFFWWKQMEYLLPFLCARIYRIPIFVASPSMGPFKQVPKRRFRRWLLKTPDVLCVREDISRQYLADIGVTENVHVAMDLAFMNDINVEAKEGLLKQDRDLSAFLESHDRVVGITISDFSWHVELGKDQKLRQRIEDSLQEFIGGLVEKQYGVLLIPQLFGNQNDSEFLAKFLKGADTMVMREDPDTYFQQYVISQLYAVVGMRYHCNIFAAKMGTPFVAIAYEEKMTGFMELVALTDYQIPIREVSLDALCKKFDRLEKNHASLCDILKAGRSDWRQRARKTAALLDAMPLKNQKGAS